MNLKSRTLLLLTLAGLWSATSWVHAQPADAQPIPLPGGGTPDASGQANTASITLAFQNTDIEPVSAAERFSTLCRSSRQVKKSASNVVP